MFILRVFERIKNLTSLLEKNIQKASLKSFDAPDIRNEIVSSLVQKDKICDEIQDILAKNLLVQKLDKKDVNFKVKLISIYNSLVILDKIKQTLDKKLVLDLKKEEKEIFKLFKNKRKISKRIK